jgi:glycosyltransferase involved in cell wall biosynthesis
MILGINGIRLVVGRSGVARCIEALLVQLDRLEHPFDEIRVYTPCELPEDIRLPSMARSLVLPSRLPLALWEQVTLPWHHGRAGVLLCPSYVAPLFSAVPTMVIHHGSYEGFPKAFNCWTLNKARAAYSMSARRAAVVTTVSEYSKRDMVRFYGLPSERIHVVPDGVDTSRFRPVPDRERRAAWRKRALGADVPFIAYVGKPTERRNLSALVHAFASLKAEKGIPHRLVIAGSDLPGTSPFRRVIRECGVEGDVEVIGYVSHEDMPLLFNAADVFVYPSSYEGFGMPVLEAMACGTPVITLDNTAFPEFAGGIAHLLPDARVETLATGIWTVLNDEALRRHMAVEGPRRAAEYDWSKVAQRYLDLLVPLAVSWARGGRGSDPDTL